MTNFGMPELQHELDSHVEPNLRKAFDVAVKGKQMLGPVFIMLATHNPNTGKDLEKPTAMPVLFQEAGPAHMMLDALRQNAVLSHAVAVFVAYPMENGMKIRGETSYLSHEWLIPILTQKDGPPYLGKRLEYGHGEGQTAKVLDDLDIFGGILPKRGSLIVTTQTAEA